MTDMLTSMELCVTAEIGFELLPEDLAEVVEALRVKRALDDAIAAFKDNVNIGEKNTKLFAQEERWSLCADYIRITDIRRGVLVELEAIARKGD